MDIKEYISSGVIELYVLGLCSPEEEKEFETLRLQYPELNTAILEYESALENQHQKEAKLPPAAVDEKVLKTLDSLNAPAIAVPIHQQNIRSFSWWKMAAAASILLLITSAVFNYLLYNKTKKQELALQNKDADNSSLPASDYEIMKNPTITPVAMYGVGSHAICRCTMFWDKKTGKIYIMIHHLPKSSESKDYQLWASVSGQQVNVGIINDAIRGRFIELSNVPPGSIAFTVTLEKAGGNTTPDMNEAYLAGKI
jgi:anti-sigma-K factor RskA